MAVNLKILPKSKVFPIPGIEIGVTATGIKKSNQYDLVLFVFSPATSVAGVLTRNKFRAAPIQICEKNLLGNHYIRALVINSGNANSGTGSQGLENAKIVCTELSKLINVSMQQILPFSTGVILEPLPLSNLLIGLPEALKNLNVNQWHEAAYGIMTTDTVPKIVSNRIYIDGKPVNFTGISKGSGMICPNMATMLGFLGTDIGIDQSLLREMINEIADVSFNRITIDGDTSTNDSFVLVATGKSGINIKSKSDKNYSILYSTLASLALELAKKIVRDGEGATKFITIHVEEAFNNREALNIAYSVAHSPLVKTAFYASDPNLGRILVAIGNADVSNLEKNKIRIWLDNKLIVSNGTRNSDFQEKDLKNIMQQSEIAIRIALGRGMVSEKIYTCDLSHQYISINANYRS